MKGREWFILGTRLIGLYVMYGGVGSISTAFMMWMARRIGYRPDDPVGYPSVYMIEAIPIVAFAFYLLFATHHLADLCYGGSGPREDRSKPEPADPLV